MPNACPPTACLLALVAGLGAADLLTADAGWRSGAATIADGQVAIAGTRVPLDRVIALRLGGRASGEALDQGAVLADGDVLAGSVAGLQGGKLRIASATLGEQVIDAARVRLVVLRAQPLAALAGLGAGEPGVALTNGDAVAGPITWINKDNVGVTVAGRITQIPRDRVALVRLPATPPAGPGAARQIVRLASGERLTGVAQALTADELRFLPAGAAQAVGLPVAQVVELWSEGGAVQPLSLLPIAAVAQVPQFDEHFPHRLDANLAGQALSVGGRRFERGLGTHSRCTLTWTLDGSWTAFVAEIGLDDLAAGRGEVEFTVLVDGKPTFTALRKGGQSAELVRVPLAGARQLVLVSDFGPDDDSSGDHADWGRAVLVR